MRPAEPPVAAPLPPLPEEAAEESPLFAEINITPLTDVVLVLLIIFMVSSSAMVDAVRAGHLDVTLPRAGHAAGAPDARPTLVIGALADGRAFVGEEVLDAEALGELLARTHAQAPQTAVIVDADGALPHRHVVALIDHIRAAGFEQVGLGAEVSP